MDADRFDTLSRALNASPTRRAALWTLATLGLWSAGDLLDPDAVNAGKKKGGKRGKKGKKGKKRKQQQDPQPQPQCPSECCPGIKGCLGNDVCCDGLCLQCCTSADCRDNGVCCPSGNCRRPDEECCGPGGSCPAGKHCCATGICRECCGDQDCPEAGTKCCTNGFCTTPNEQCCQDEDCPNQQLPICCATSSGGTACSQCCADEDCPNSLRPLCCERETGRHACDQCCVDTDCPAGQRCHPLGDCVFCLPPGGNCMTDFGCCSDNCVPDCEGCLSGKCA